MGSKKGSKRREWIQENMELALSACRNGSSIRSAAKEHNVPRKTLADRVNKKVKSDNPKLGVETILTQDDEKSLYNYIEFMANHSCSLTVTQI